MAAKKRYQGQAEPMPAFEPYQLCRLERQPPEGDAWSHELKLDGYRLQARVEGGNVTLLTKNGIDWTSKFPALCAAATALPDCLLDGELCALGPDGQPSFSALVSSIAKGETAELVYFAFDLMWEGRNHDMRPYALSVRKHRLRALVEGLDADNVRFVDEVNGPGRGLLQAACALKLEGIVSKRRDAPYREGLTGAWIKAKCRPSFEAIVGGWTQSGPSLSSLYLGVPDGDRLRYVGRVSTGFSGATLRVLGPALKALRCDVSPFPAGSIARKSGEVIWARPELVVEITAAEINARGKIRQGSFYRLRQDKTAADVNLRDWEIATS